MDRDKLFNSFFGFIVLVDRCKQVKDFALNVVSNLRFGIAVIRKIAHCAADCFPFCISKEFGDRAKIGGCFVHVCIIAGLRVNCKRGWTALVTGFQSPLRYSASSSSYCSCVSNVRPWITQGKVLAGPAEEQS